MLKNFIAQVFSRQQSLTFEAQRLKILRQMCCLFFIIAFSNLPVWLIAALLSGQAIFWLLLVACSSVVVGQIVALILSFKTSLADYLAVGVTFLSFVAVHFALGGGYNIEMSYCICVIAATTVRGWKAGAGWASAGLLISIIINLGQILGNYNGLVTLEESTAQIARYIIVFLDPVILTLLILFVLNNVLTNSRLAIEQSQELRRLSGLLQQQRMASAEVSQLVLSTTNELNATAAQQANNANQQRQAIQEVSANLQEMNATAEQIAQSALAVQEKAVFMFDTTQQVQAIVTQAANNGNVGEQLVNSSVERITVVSELYKELNNNLINLRTTTADIRQILVLTKDIADQTHLLSLNAAIEAAGAGEYGLRFSIVAQEVKTLAARSLQAGQSVSLLIEKIETAVTLSVNMANKGQESILEAVAIAKESGTTIHALAQVTSLAASQSNAIAKLTEEVKLNAKEISLATRQQRTASEQVVIMVTQVNQAALQTSLVSAQLAQTVATLHDLSARLNNSLVNVN